MIRCISCNFACLDYEKKDFYKHKCINYLYIKQLEKEE